MISYKLVLNLVISGIPSIHNVINKLADNLMKVLNLVISGIPSILKRLKSLAFSVGLF